MEPATREIKISGVFPRMAVDESRSRVLAFDVFLERFLEPKLGYWLEFNGCDNQMERFLGAISGERIGQFCSLFLGRFIDLSGSSWPWISFGYAERF